MWVNAFWRGVIMIGNLSKAFRVKHNIYQAVAAKMYGCTVATLSRIEAGTQQPKAPLVISILNVVLPEFKQQILLADLDADYIIQSHNRTENYHKSVKVRSNL